MRAHGKAQQVGPPLSPSPGGKRGPFLLPQGTVGTLHPSSRQWSPSLPGGSDSEAWPWGFILNCASLAPDPGCQSMTPWPQWLQSNGVHQEV